jgi:hypothetical protein
MGHQLTKNSVMECPRHGTRKPTFVCHHLSDGKGLGFHLPAGPMDPDLPFKNAWCDDCDRAFRGQGDEWNDVSEEEAKVMAICEGCFEEIRRRNDMAAERGD